MKREAEVLIQCGFNNEYGDYYITTFGDHIKSGNYKEDYWPDGVDAIILERIEETDRYFFFVEPYLDTLDGRKQLDAIEQHIRIHTMPVIDKYVVWSSLLLGEKRTIETDDPRDARIEYIKWALNQL